MKVLIFGSSGMLGGYVTNFLKSLSYTDNVGNTLITIIEANRHLYDIDCLSNDSIESFLKEQQLDNTSIVINCAGIIPQSKPEKQQYYKINLLFPILLGNICDKICCRLIHITTDCVFDGNGTLYNELSKHTSTSDYGVSKSLGENCNATIIRTSIIGEEFKNKYSLLEWVKLDKQSNYINGYTNHYWNGITCLQLAKIIGYMILNNFYWKGVRHIFSSRIITKYELIVIINNIYKLNFNVVENSMTDKKDLTLSSIYPCFINIPTIEEQICELYQYDLYNYRQKQTTVFINKLDYHEKNINSLLWSINYNNWKKVNSIEEANIIFSSANNLLSDKYPHKKFIFGPHFSVFPNDEALKINNIHKNSIYIQPSQWAVDVWSLEKKFDKSPVKVYAFGVDTDKFNRENVANVSNTVLIYIKRRNVNDCMHIINFLHYKGFRLEIFNYQSKYKEVEYIQALKMCSFGVWIGQHESQGFALLECLSMNVPLIVWNVKSMSQEENSPHDYNYIQTQATTIPYWDERCGEYFYNQEEFESVFEKFKLKLDDGYYKPREYVVENLSLEKSAIQLRIMTDGI